MGNGRLSKRLFGGKEEIKIMILGLDSSGKTTLLYKLNKSGVTTTIPTIGMNVESTTCKNIHITSWDVGGRDKIRPLLWHYYRLMDAVLFVVDSADPGWQAERARDVLIKLMQEEDLSNLPFLVLANKQDLPTAMNVARVAEVLGIDKLRRDSTRAVDILPVSALTGDGVVEALEWVQRHLIRQKAQDALVKPAQKAVPPSLVSLFSSLSSTVKQTLGNSRI